MFHFFRREPSKKKQVFICLDIGTELVKALVCEPQGAQTIVHGVGRQQQKMGDMQSGAVMDMGSVTANCAKAIEEATRQAQMYPRDIVIGIAGELIKGMTTAATYSRTEANVKIDLSELKNIIHKMQWKAFEETRNQIAFELCCNPLDVKLLHAGIVSLSIDGYGVSNPIGFQGKEVHISIFNAFAPMIHYGALQTIAAELDLNLLAILAEPFAVARCLEDEDAQISSKRSALFIDIGGGTTDMAIVQNGSLEGTRMFTIGGRTFTKRLASTLNISFQEAEEIKCAYSEGTLEKQSEKIVRSALQSDIEVWLEGIVYSLSEFGGNTGLPTKIYLCGGSSKLPEIAEALSGNEWHRSLNFEKPPTISLLFPRHIPSVQDTSRRLTEISDVTPMALAHIGSEHIGEEHLMNRLLKNVIRLMNI